MPNTGVFMTIFSYLIRASSSACYQSSLLVEYDQSFDYIQGIPKVFMPDVTSSVSSSFTFTAWIKFDAIAEDKSGSSMTPIRISCIKGGVTQFYN